jgi:Domain of unknown function (DUF4328)
MSGSPVRVFELRMTAQTAIASLSVVIGCDLARLAVFYLRADRRYAWLDLGSRQVFAIALLSTIITFLWWLYVALRNLQRWGLRPRWGPGWAIGSWLIPVVDLVLPMLVVREAARRSGSGRGGSTLVVVWWVVFLVGEGLADFSDLDPLVIVPLYVAAAALAIAVVAHITRLQLRRHAAAGAVVAAGPRTHAPTAMIRPHR